MPVLEHHGASIHYEVHGKGFPILTFAPGGLHSAIAVWSQPMSPINPVSEWSDAYQVIVMDQRNAPEGRSRAPITAQDGWHSFVADHMALLDHVGVERCHLYGQCIGGPFIMALLKAHPERVASAVVAQANGRVGPMPEARSPRFEDWVREVKKTHPEATDDVIEAFYQNLYAAGHLYSVGRDFLPTCKTPCLVLAGNDEAHPLPLSEDMATLMPKAEFVREWKTGAVLEAVRPRIKAFLAKHTPA